MSDDETCETDTHPGLEALFYLTLRFEHAFARLAIDKYDVDDELAEREAAKMEKLGSTGVTFAACLRRIQHERNSRVVGHMVSAVWAARGTKDPIALVDVRAEYDKLNRGDA